MPIYTPKGYVEEILRMSFRACQKEEMTVKDLFKKPIIHKQINGAEVYIPLNKGLWNIWTILINKRFKGGNSMSEVNNDNKITKSKDPSNDSISGGPIGNQLNSDNAFSDSGLENARLLNKAMKKEKSE